MKCLASLVVVMLACHTALAEEACKSLHQPCPAPPAPAAPMPDAQDSSLTKVQHLRAAAEHLEAAGLHSEAEMLRNQAMCELQRTREMLEQKMAELQKLKTKIARLHAELHSGPQIAASISLFECDDAQLKRLRPVCSKGASDKAEHDKERFWFVLPDEHARHLLDKLQECHREGRGKMLAAPTLTMAEGIPGHCHVGGEFPVPVPQSKGTVSIEFMKFGTMIDLVNLLVDKHKIRTELRVRQSQPVQPHCSSTFIVPNLRTMEFNTGFELESGQTIVLCDPFSSQIEAKTGCAAAEAEACCAEDDAACCKDAEKQACGSAKKRLLVVVRIERKNLEDRCAAAPAATRR